MNVCLHMYVHMYLCIRALMCRCVCVHVRVDCYKHMYDVYIQCMNKVQSANQDLYVCTIPFARSYTHAYDLLQRPIRRCKQHIHATTLAQHSRGTWQISSKSCKTSNPNEKDQIASLFSPISLSFPCTNST
jgi:hypothetical protein